MKKISKAPQKILNVAAMFPRLTAVFPWQQEPWERIQSAYLRQQIPQALLLLGPLGLGHKHFALQVAALLVCLGPKNTTACGNCHACQLFKAGTHPDLLFVEPEAPTRIIKIEQIREMVAAIAETSMQGRYRVVIINPATALNLASANALLKTLEEPAPNTLIILISQQHLQLPATIVSRCHQIVFKKPLPIVASEWLHSTLASAGSDIHVNSVDCGLLLQLTDGVPLTALEWLTDGTFALRADFYQDLVSLSQNQRHPVQVAAKWQTQSYVTMFNLLLSWLSDLLYCKLGTGKVVHNVDYQDFFNRLEISVVSVMTYIDHVQSRYKNIMELPNINFQLVLEELFIRWTYVSR